MSEGRRERGQRGGGGGGTTQANMADFSMSSGAAPEQKGKTSPAGPAWLPGQPGLQPCVSNVNALMSECSFKRSLDKNSRSASISLLFEKGEKRKRFFK